MRRAGVDEAVEVVAGVDGEVAAGGPLLLVPHQLELDQLPRGDGDAKEVAIAVLFVGWLGVLPRERSVAPPQADAPAALWIAHLHDRGMHGGCEALLIGHAARFEASRRGLSITA